VSSEEQFDISVQRDLGLVVIKTVRSSAYCNPALSMLDSMSLMYIIKRSGDSTLLWEAYLTCCC